MSTASPLTKSDQKRQQILDAGRELFMTQGYADTSMDQVTAKSGVSKATVYNHFPSKEIRLKKPSKLVQKRSSLRCLNWTSNMPILKKC